MRCPRCFYLDRRLGVGQPPGYPFNLNSAVDVLLKKEFDYYRQRQEPHPLLIENGIEAIPFLHSQLDEWRDSLHHGIQFQIPNTNIIVTGGVDDVWINTATQELIIVDYKATSKLGEVSLDAEWQIGYKRQAEVYQWLFRQNGFSVSMLPILFTVMAAQTLIVLISSSCLIFLLSLMWVIVNGWNLLFIKHMSAYVRTRYHHMLSIVIFVSIHWH